MTDVLQITCPRCGLHGTQRFYGPCALCREQLRSQFSGLARQVDAPEYVPKMNVTPNAVAQKDD